MNALVQLALAGMLACRDLEVPALEPAAAPSTQAALPEWIHLVPYGEWHGHRGGSFRVGPAEAARMVANFAAMKRDLVIDYEHQTHATEDNGHPAPAAGWIDRVEVRADGVWGHVKEWTPRAATHLREREYRYLSPVIAWRFPNKVTRVDQGATLLSVALTNTPFFDVLTPVLARTNPGRSMDLQLLALLGLTEGATPEQVHAAALGLVAANKSACKALGLPETAKPAEIETAAAFTAARASLGAIVIRELKLDEKALPADLDARLCRELKHSGYVPYTEHVAAITAGSEKLDALTDDQIVERGIQKGVITPALVTWARSQVKKDREGMMEFVAKGAGVPVTPTATTTANRPARAAGEAALDEEDLVLCRQLGIDTKAYATLATKEGR